MLSLTIRPKEFWNEHKQEFIIYPAKEITIQMEYSLIALSKWETKYCKPFLDKKNKTEEEYLYFLKCMCIDKNVDENLFKTLSEEERQEIKDYMNSPLSGTVVNYRKKKPHSANKIITSEVIYSQMASLRIPFICEKWPLQRLMKLIEVTSLNESPPDKMSKGDILRQNAAINAKRRKPKKP